MTLSRNSSSSRWNDRRLGLVLGAVAAVSGSIVLLIVVFLLREAAPVVGHVGLLRFFTGTAWFPLEGKFGLTPMVVATILVSLGALLIAVPLGVGMSLFCSHYAPPRVARLARGLVALLAGIPSVVFGFWGLTVLVPLVGDLQPPGASLFAGALVLAIMILPTIALTSDAALASAPAHLGTAAAALGLSREAAILHVLLPAVRASIGAGILLAGARALGETMAILMVAGNVVQIPSSVFDPVRTLTANIALEMAYATADHRSALFVSGLVLTVMVFLLAALSWRMTEGQRHG